jgi:cell wall-associated NlpC family hydrolase
MGETAHELLREGDWYLVRLQDDYQGWVRSWYVAESDEYEVQSFMHRAGVRVESNIAYVRSQPAPDSLPVAEVVAGTTLIAERAKGGFRRVHLPGGRAGFIQEEHLGEPPAGTPDGERIAARAKRFLGISYLWGGTSPKGFDCSGFIKRVFGLEGIALPRDSDLQARVGTRIPREEVPMTGPGDLVFFGEGRTINHVAITLGGGYFIHAYGEVRVNSLNEGDTLFEGKLAGSLLFGRSVLA